VAALNTDTQVRVLQTLRDSREIVSDFATRLQQRDASGVVTIVGSTVDSYVASCNSFVAGVDALLREAKQA